MRIDPSQLDPGYAESDDEEDEFQLRSRAMSVLSQASDMSAVTASTAPTDCSEDQNDVMLRNDVASSKDEVIPHEDVKTEDENLLQIHRFTKPKEFDTLGGHAGGIQVSEADDGVGEFILKKTDKDEIDFYDRVAAGDPPVSAIATYVPEYFGSVKHSRTDQQGSTFVPPRKLGIIVDPELGIKPLTKANTAQTHGQSIILSNVLYGLEPETVTCADWKIGNVMHTPDASEAKKKQMIGQVERSTSKYYAVRHVWGETAMQSEDGRFSKVRAGKEYGYSLRKNPDDTDSGRETLDDGVARYFPIPGDEILPKDDDTMQRETQARKDQSTALGQSQVTKSDIYHPDRKSTSTGVQSNPAPSLSGAWTPQSGSEAQTRARAVSKKKAAIRGMRDVILKTQSELEGMAEAIEKTNWRYTGASVLLAHGIPKDTSISAPDTGNETSDRPDSQKPVLSLPGTANSRMSCQTAPGTVATDAGRPESSRGSPSDMNTDEREVRVFLLDHARGGFEPGSDHGALHGLSNLQKALSRRLETLATEESKCVAELEYLTDLTSHVNSTSVPASTISAGNLPSSDIRTRNRVFSPLATIYSDEPPAPHRLLSYRRSKERLSPSPTALPTLTTDRRRGSGRRSWSMSRDEALQKLSTLQKSSSFTSVSSILGSALGGRVI
ncbi:hypothetical protein IAT40_005560 [Kwoniella sp. CBS 6097]